MNQLERQVLDAIDVEGMISFLCRLIAKPSLDGQESPAQELVADQMTRSGLQVDMWEIDLQELRRHPASCEEVVRTEALGVVGRIGHDAGSRSLILNGHVDVVPAGDADRWTYPPWRGTLTDRHVFGRGSADMKGGLCCALFAAKAVRDAGIQLASPLLVHSVVGEEDGGTGTLAALLRGHLASAAVIMEPTDLEVVTTQAGALNFRLTVPGKAAHGAMRAEGVSALEKFLPVFEAIAELERARNTRVEQPLLAEYELPYPISIGTLRAGNWASSVPDELCCEGRFGVVVGEAPEEARGVFETAVHEAAQADPWLRQHSPTVEWWGGQFAPAETSTDHPLVGILRHTVRDLTTREPRIKGVTYGADMRLLVNEGRIPTVLFGPGDVKLAHQTDEHVPIDDLLIAVRSLALTAMRYCGVV
jgi:acetylornithine deacetylase